MIARTLFAAGLCFAMSASAATETPSERTLDTVVVSGNQPGPGLWKVSKDDRVLWILGTLSPLPKRMEWESRDVEATIADSQELIMPPRATVSIKGGALKALILMPSLMSARNNPEKQKLVDVVPPALYARWAALKKQYLGRDEAVEKRRPIVAAFELYEEAIEDTGMSFKDVVTPLVKKTAKKHDLTITDPTVEIRIEAPKAAVKELKQTSLDDLPCFEKTLDRLDADLETMVWRANAWATGDVQALREMPYTDQTRECLDAVLNAGIAESVGMKDLDKRVAAEWVKHAEAALAKNRSTFALLPIRAITEDADFVGALAARGYIVEPPAPSR